MIDLFGLEVSLNSLHVAITELRELLQEERETDGDHHV